MANRQSSIPLPTGARRVTAGTGSASAVPSSNGGSTSTGIPRAAPTPASSRPRIAGSSTTDGPERRTLLNARSNTASMRQSLASSSSNVGTAGTKRPLSVTGFAREDSGDPDSKRSQATPARLVSRSGGASSPDSLDVRPSSSAYDARMLRDEYERRHLADQLKYEALETHMRELGREMDKLRREQTSVISHWESDREKAKAEEANLREQKALAEKSLKSIRAEHSQITELYNDLQASSSQELQALRSENSRLSSRVVHLEADVGRAHEEAQSVQVREEALTTERDELAALLDKQEAEWRREREKLKWGGEEGEAAKAELTRQLTQVHQLESANASLKVENSTLKKHSASVEVLREEKAALQSRLQVLDTLRRQLAEAEGKATRLQLERDDWNRTIADSISSTALLTNEESIAASIDEPLPPLPPIPAALTPLNFPQYLRSLRSLASGLRVRCEGLGSQLSAARQRASEVLEVEEIKPDAEAIQTLETKLKSVQERSDRTVAVLKDEVERYKNFLQSYELESKSERGGTYDASHAERITMLEQRNNELSATVQALEEEVEKGGKMETDEHDDLSMRVAQLQKELEAAKAENIQMVTECTRLETENDKLWERVGRGEFNVANERCIVLKDNPVSRDLAVRTATLDSLRMENSELLKRVEELAATAGNVGDALKPGEAGDALVPVQIVENLKGEIQGLQESIKVKDKAMLRLKQVFSAKANEYREAVRSLFGYKVRFLESGKVKLTSSFARGSRGTSLVFGSDDGNVGTMKLTGEATDENAGIANVADLKAYWLSDLRHSVPCFLAALNLELYESTTQAVRAGWNVEEEEEG